MTKFFKVLFLAIAFIAPCFNVLADAPTISITMSKTDVVNGYELVASITNNPGIAGYNLLMEFDKTRLTPVSITEGDAIKNRMIFISNLTNASDEEKATMDVVTAVLGAAQNNPDDGVLYTVLFQSIHDVEGEIYITLISKGIGNEDMQEIDFRLQGTVVDFALLNSFIGNPAVESNYDASTEESSNKGLATSSVIIIILLAIIAILSVLLLRNKKH